MEDQKAYSIEYHERNHHVIDRDASCLNTHTRDEEDASGKAEESKRSGICKFAMVNR